MSDQRFRGIRWRTWPVVALAMVGLLALIAASILAARQKADDAYRQLDSLNNRYRDVESRLRLVRSDLHLSGIIVRDYLLDRNAPTGEYRARLLQLKLESSRLLEELKPLVRPGDPGRYDMLRNELINYWQAYEPLFDRSPNEERYDFLRREVVPRRDAVMAISAEIEDIATSTFRAQRDAAASRQQELRRSLTSMLETSLALGLLVAVCAAVQIRRLQRRSENEHARIEQAEHEMRRLSNQLVHMQEEERRHLSRELHDEVGQMLTALRMELGRLERAHVVGSPTFGATIAEGKTLVDKMMRSVRDLAMGLRPSMLDDLGIEPALAWQSRDFSRRYNVPVELAVEGDLERLPDAHRTCIYRVVQEALTNCAKHARATVIHVTVRGTADDVEVAVADNGIGIDESSRHGGLGLTGIKERVKEMNGTVTIGPGESGGTMLQARLPVPASNPRRENLANIAG